MGKHRETLRPLAVVSLALLAERPMHPYEMYQLLLARGKDQMVKVRPGTLYHVIGGLAEAGLVVATGTEREGNRPERTTYAITDAGTQVLEEAVVAMIESPQPEYPDFTVAIGEAHALPLELVIQLLQSRLKAVTASRDRGQRLLDSAIKRKVPRRFLLSGEFAINRAAGDMAWLTTLISQLESGELSWDAALPTVTKDSQ